MRLFYNMVMKKEVTEEASQAGRSMAQIRWGKATSEDRKRQNELMNKGRFKKNGVRTKRVK